MPLFEDENAIICIDKSWSNDFSVGLVGWIIGKQHPIDEVEVFIGESRTAITSWHRRPDLAKIYPNYRVTERCGFVVHLPHRAEHRVKFSVRSAGGPYNKTVDFIGYKPPKPKDFPSDGGFSEFINLVNNNHLKVLEIGSRVVGNASRRSLFPGASYYAGFDYYPDSNTDVVGDAHKLSSYFGDERFDAIFSDSVLEHLAMPWLVVIEINKLLKLGGVTFHSTPCCWPVHERPWDFWRISDFGLKILFSRALGFEVVKVGLTAPLYMYSDELVAGWEELPFAISFANAAILARKIGEIDSAKVAWNIRLEDVLEPHSFYPR